MKKVLRFLLGAFRLNGVDPRYQGIISNILKILTSLGAFFLLLTYILEIVFNWKGVKTLAKIYMFPAICMMVLKALTLQTKTGNLMEIITKIEAFIPLTRFGGPVEKRLNSIFEKTEKYTKIYFGLCMGLILIFTIMPFVTNDRSLYFDAYDFCDVNTNPCFIYYFTWQNAALFLVAMTNVIGFDCLFLYFVAEAYCSFEVTKHMLNSIQGKDVDRNQLDEFVKQHDEAMNYVKELNRLYSTLMLAQCWFSMSALILSLYVLTSEGIPPPMPFLIKFGGLYMFFALQFFVYCFGGNVIMEQSKSVSEVAFDVDWWSQSRFELRKSLVLIIARSQRVEKITVGHIMDLNFECFVKVLSNSLSAYTLLLTMEKKGNMLQN